MEAAKDLLFRWVILIFYIIEIKTKNKQIIDPLNSNMNDIVLKKKLFSENTNERVESFSVFTNLFNVAL